MTDLSRLIADLCAGLDSPERPTLSTFVETLSTAEIQQPIDMSTCFHSFHSFHSENEQPRSNAPTTGLNEISTPGGSRASSLCVGAVERVETVESGVKTSAETRSLPFPLYLSEMERVERKSGPCERPTLDLNRAGLISAADVRAGVEREMRALAEDGCTGPDALRDAVAITRSKIRNSPVLGERQFHDGRCHVCGSALDDARPVVAVMQAKGGRLWLHSECHSEHSRRTAALVDSIMAAAGYGADRREGEAA